MAITVPGQCNVLRVRTRSDLPGTTSLDSRGLGARFKPRAEQLRSRARIVAPAPEEPVISLDPRTWPKSIRGGAAITLMVPASFGLARSNASWIESAFVIVLLIISLGVHEAAHAWSAWKLGDSTAKDMGRMTVNPIVHIDPFMTILLPAMCAIAGAPIFGGAKPVPVNFNRLRNPWPDMAIVAFAGPLSNLLLAGLFYALYKVFVLTGFYNGAAITELARQSDLLPTIMYRSMEYNVLLFVFNLIPIPPLDGSRIMANALPPSLRENYVRISGFGLVLVFLLINYVEPFQVLVFSVMNQVEHLVMNTVTLGHRW